MNPNQIEKTKKDLFLQMQLDPARIEAVSKGFDGVNDNGADPVNQIRPALRLIAKPMAILYYNDVNACPDRYLREGVDGPFYSGLMLDVTRLQPGASLSDLLSKYDSDRIVNYMLKLPFSPPVSTFGCDPR